MFVVDGAHRVSALVAWVNDDYGDGPISREVFGANIEAAQKRFHKRTKKLIDAEIGTYAQLLYHASNPTTTADEAILRRGRAIATRQPSIQKVDGTAAVVEKSFLVINSNPATIDKTELDVIRARRKPNAIATRAIIKAGVGKAYWAKFPRENVERIKAVALEVYDLLFGDIAEVHSQSPDVPRSGQPYSDEAFKMILDMVNIFNGVSPAMWQQTAFGLGKRQTVEQLGDDADGAATIGFLGKVKDVAKLTAGNEYSGSLGMDHLVYRWGNNGSFHPAAFLASLRFAQELEREDKLVSFTLVRSEFEEFIVNHQQFLNDLAHSKGSRTRPLESVLTMHRIVFTTLAAGVLDDAEIVRRLESEPSLSAIKRSAESGQVPPATRRRFSKSVERAAIVRDLLASRPRCSICNARLPPHSRSKDHVQKQADGGAGNVENLGFTHPFCNSARDKIVATKKKGSAAGSSA